jgi:hypothetical protein
MPDHPDLTFGRERVPLRAAVIDIMSRREPREMHAALREAVARRPGADTLWLAYRAGRSDGRAAIYAKYGY